MAKVKHQGWLVPHGQRQKIAKSVGMSYDTVCKVLKGKIKGVCSEENAARIYKVAPKFGAIKFFPFVPKT